MATDVQLLGRVILSGQIETQSGLHIGGSPGALAIGGVDLPIIRDARSNRPYIPGSSLKGKMRSQAEKLTQAPQNRPIGRGVRIHVAESADEYTRYWVNPIFGVPGEVAFHIPAPNRLVVRDVPLDRASDEALLGVRTDLPYTEVKWEIAIDRLNSAAAPRQIERVPAGTVFAPMALVFSVFLATDIVLFDHLLTCLQLVEDDYIGGMGSRGSGKIAFLNLAVTCKRGAAYTEARDARFAAVSLAELVARRDDMKTWLKQMFNV